MSRKRETHAQETCRLLAAGRYKVDGQKVTLREPKTRGVVTEPVYRSVRAAPAGAPAGLRLRAVRASSFAAASQLVLEEGHPSVAVLDFASDSEPGGGWRGRQQGTQEEALCRASSLGRALERLPYPLATYGAAVVPEVVVFRSDDRECRLLPRPFQVGVVAAALRNFGDGDMALDGTQRAHLARKVDSVLAAAANHGFRELVLGAWGCGAFGNGAAHVAAAFVQALQGDYDGIFRQVVFAVPQAGEALRAFQSAVDRAQQLAPEPDPE